MRSPESIWRTVKRELAAHAPAMLLLVTAGTVTALLYATLGLPALVCFAVLALLPQVTLPFVLRRAPMNELDHTQAVMLFAEAIASVMKLSRCDRLVLRDAAPFMRDRRTKPFASAVSKSNSAHRVAMAETVLFCREHWDGTAGHPGIAGGRPGALGGDMIPLTSRILAVADAWSGLTANGTPELAHSQALLQLEARAGMHFDPRVVAAAAHVIRQERMGRLTDPPFQPRLHRVRLPNLARLLRALSPLWRADDPRREHVMRRHGEPGAGRSLYEAPRV
jgi:hypothetical protein